MNCMLSAAAPVAAQTAQELEIRTVPVADGIYMLTGGGGNVGLSVGVDGPFMIDDQLAFLDAAVQKAVSALTEEPVRFVLNTHWHGDHTGGNESLGKSGALIVAHENVRKRLDPEEFRGLIGNSRQAPPAALPVVTFSDAMTFHWNGDDIRVMHIEHAHTDGDAIVWFPRKNVIHMGDIYFSGQYPVIDLNSEGSISGVIKGVRQALRIADAESRIIPGHGPLSGTTQLREYLHMLTTVLERVQALMVTGMQEAAVIAARPTSDLDAKWGNGYVSGDQFVAAVYQSIRNH